MHAEAAAAIVEVYRELDRQRLISGSAGNVSVRLGAGMLITPTGATAASLTAEELVLMPAGGPPPPGTGPSSEWPMHAAVYQVCPEAACVVHTHADSCTALACLNEPLPAFHYMVAGFGGDTVPCAPYTTFGTPALAESVGATIPGHTACLLANHGMIAHGTTPHSALAAAVQLETLARQYLLARAAGTPRLLTAAEMSDARERFKTYGIRPGPAA
jgi:L-fuculose-phosphate aldolase